MRKYCFIITTATVSNHVVPVVVVVFGVFTVAVYITKMISDLGYPTVDSQHFIRYKFHHSVLPSCEGSSSLATCCSKENTSSKTRLC